jgi:putative phosphoribosyl transferase
MQTSRAARGFGSPPFDDLRPIRIGERPVLEAILGVPPGATGLVIFAHGSGSGRLSSRNNYVAARLREARFATLLLDLLTPQEELDRGNVFDIGLLAGRLRLATEWAAAAPETAALKPCYFGASTGAGAALLAAAGDERIAAVVSRGGRPDLAGARALAEVRAPTLLIVGGLDGVVINLNRAAADAMSCERSLVVVPGAGHLFEEPGTLDRVVEHARAWFIAHLAGGRQST